MSQVIIKATRRWYWQRITAMVMALFVFIHLAVMVHAIQGGLSAAEVLERTRGNIAWMLFYASFVVLVAVHAAIGMRNVLVEWLSLNDRTASLLSRLLSLLLLIMGLRAVWAVTVGGPA